MKRVLKMTQLGLKYCPLVKFSQMHEHLSSDVSRWRLIFFSPHPSFLHLSPNAEHPVVEAGCSVKSTLEPVET